MAHSAPSTAQALSRPQPPLPGSPPTVNGTTPRYPGELQHDDIPVPEVLPADCPPARPDRWAKAPGRIRLGLTSFGRSTAVPTGPGPRPSLPVRQLQSRRLGPRDGRDRHRNGQHPHGRRFDRVIPTVGLVQVGQVRPKRSYMPWLGSVTKATRCPSRVDFANSLASRPQQPTV